MRRRHCERSAFATPISVRHSGARVARARNHTPDRGYGFRAQPCGLPRNDDTEKVGVAMMTAAAERRPPVSVDAREHRELADALVLVGIEEGGVVAKRDAAVG